MIKVIHRKKYEHYDTWGRRSTYLDLIKLGIKLGEGLYADGTPLPPQSARWYKGCEFRIEERTITRTVDVTPWHRARKPIEEGVRAK